VLLAAARLTARRRVELGAGLVSAEVGVVVRSAVGIVLGGLRLPVVALAELIARLAHAASVPIARWPESSLTR
jgi:hypothetical protein